MTDRRACFRLDDKVVILTGASSGLGAQFARVLDAAGVELVLVGRRSERLERLAGELRHALPVRCDLSAADSAGRVVDAALDHFGRLDALINNAGVVDVHPAEDEPIEQLRETINQSGRPVRTRAAGSTRDASVRPRRSRHQHRLRTGHGWRRRHPAGRLQSLERRPHKPDARALGTMGPEGYPRQAR